MLSVPFSDSRDLVPVSSGAIQHPGESERQARISDLLPYFLAYAKAELRLSPETVLKYRESMVTILKIIGDLAPGEIRKEHVLNIKARCTERNLSAARIASLVYALKSFLKFCRLALGVETIDTRDIHSPKIPKREVLFLTQEEVQDFVAQIPIRRSPRKFDMRWLAFRVLVEVLLGTGMRLSEALSLKRTSINFETGEATIVGKGNKERVVFFSPRALNWVKEYVSRRSDASPYLFVVCKARRLTRETAVTWFRRFHNKAGIKKKVTAHILRHTVATTLLFNGCPIGHIREILGHEHLVTTCKFYLGCDKRAAKGAHGKYLNYDIPKR